MYIRIYLFICTYVLCFVFVCKQAQRMTQPLFAVQFTLHNHSVYLSFLLPSSPLLCFFFAVHPSISFFILPVLAGLQFKKVVLHISPWCELWWHLEKTSPNLKHCPNYKDHLSPPTTGQEVKDDKPNLLGWLP